MPATSSFPGLAAVAASKLTDAALIAAYDSDGVTKRVTLAQLRAQMGGAGVVHVVSAPHSADATGTDDATDACQSAADALGDGGLLVFGPGTYRLPGTLHITARGTRIVGYGATIQTEGLGVNAFSIEADDVTMQGFTFASTGTGTASDIFVFAGDAANFTFRENTVGRGRVFVRSTASTTLDRVRIEDNEFLGDYTGTSGADVNNIVDIRGVTNVLVRGNRWVAKNFDKALKISTAIGDAAPYDTGRSRRVIVTDNLFDAQNTTTQQIVGFGLSMEELVCAHNVFAVSGTVGSIIGIKSGVTGLDAGPYVNNLDISSNVFRLDGTISIPLFVEGPWGLPFFTVKAKARISGNVFQESVASTAPAITVKGLNVAVICDNVREAPAGAFSRWIQVSNSQLAIVRGNASTYGTIEFVGNGQTQGGETYANQPESIVCVENVLDDYEAAGGIMLSLLAAEDVTIADNHIRNQTDSGSITAAITYNGSVTVGRLMIHDNVAHLANAGKDTIGGSVTATVSKIHDNSWQ